MRNFMRQFYGVFLGLIALVLLGLLAVCLVLAMMNITSGISQTIGPPDGVSKPALFKIDDAASIGLN